MSDFSESYPQFFKVYVPDQSSYRLRIPPDFVKYITGALPYKSTITSQEKRSWHVDLENVDGHLYLQEGWQQFVHDNSLEFGDFLLFYYGGNAQFYVKIYGKNSCQKKVSGPIRETDREITNAKDNQTAKRRRSKRLARGANDVQITQKELFPRFSSANQEGNRARKEASKFLSEFPFFEIVMSPSYIKGGVMNIPSSFHNMYMEKNRDGVILVASDKSWPVKLSKTDRCARKFIHGWSTFSEENKLKADDVCVFELIEKKDFVLKVSIFRSSDSPVNMASNGHRWRSGDRSNLSSSQVKAPPHFFKIIHSSVVLRQKLRIPKKFISQYGKNLENRVFLRVPSGAVWTVELVTSNGDVWMCNGWKEFAKFYSLGFGHLLVFRYDGSYNFHVLIFDKSASEIEYPVSENHGEETNINGNGNLKIPKTEAIEIDDSVETLGDIPCATYSTGREEIYRRPRRDDIEKLGIRSYQKTRQASYCRANIERDISIEILDDSLVPDFQVSVQGRPNKESRTENNFNMQDFLPDIQSKGVKLPNQKKNVKLEIETEEYPGGTSIEQSRHRSRMPAKMQSVTANVTQQP